MKKKQRIFSIGLISTSLLVQPLTPFLGEGMPVLAETQKSLSEESVGQEAIEASASVNRSFHYGEHGLLDIDIENNSDITIDRITADLSAIDGPSELDISPELNRITLSVNHMVEPGTYPIEITVWDENNGYYVTETEVTILPRDKAEGERDWDEEIIYFMLTDRFSDGDESNNNPYDLDYESASNPRGTYQGGDFKGVTDNLDYLKDLGVSTIWLTPIVENVAHDVEYSRDNFTYYGYHGYWAKNFEELNPHLGTLEEFHELIDSAADYEMKIMVDVVLNHPGYGMHPNNNGESPTDGFPTDEDRLRMEGMIRENSGRDDITMELSGLPDFETEQKQVREQLVDWQASWIERSTTPNGNAIASFRVDTVKHVDHTTWQHFKNELIERNPAFKLIGESWGAAYQNTQGYLHSGMMDSLLDFGFKDIASSFTGGRLERANQSLIDRNAILTSDGSLGQFLGSHDENGFLFTHGDNIGKLKIAASLQMTAKGQPVIYYGEELGQSGAENWPVYDNRYDFGWELVEGNDTLEHYQKLLAFRHNFSEILSRGDRTTFLGSDDEEWLMVERSLKDESVYMALNVSEEEQTITIQTDNDRTILTDHYSLEEFKASEEDGSYTMTFTIPAMADGGTALLTVENGKLIDSSNEEITETEETEIQETSENDSIAAEEAGFFERMMTAIREWFTNLIN